MVGYTILKAGYDICRDAMREALDVGFLSRVQNCGITRSGVSTIRPV